MCYVWCVCVHMCVPQSRCQHQPSPQLWLLDPSPLDLLLDFSDVLQVGAWYDHVAEPTCKYRVETVERLMTKSIRYGLPLPPPLSLSPLSLSPLSFSPLSFSSPPSPPSPSSQVSVYALGRAYLKLSAALHINPPALGEPAGLSLPSSVGMGRGGGGAL